MFNSLLVVYLILVYKSFVLFKRKFVDFFLFLLILVATHWIFVQLFHVPKKKQQTNLIEIGQFSKEFEFKKKNTFDMVKNCNKNNKNR